MSRTAHQDTHDSLNGLPAPTLEPCVLLCPQNQPHHLFINVKSSHICISRVMQSVRTHQIISMVWDNRSVFLAHIRVPCLSAFLVDEQRSSRLLSSCSSEVLWESRVLYFKQERETEDRGGGHILYYIGPKVTHSTSIHIPLVRTGHWGPHSQMLLNCLFWRQEYGLCDN